MSTTSHYERVARRVAKAEGLDPDTFVRQIRQESGFNPSARSPAGARGIAQIMPATAQAWGVNPDNPVAALKAAAKNMARYVHQFGSYHDALVAYNAGPGAVGRPLPAETQNYIKVILGDGEPKKHSTAVQHLRSQLGTGGPEAPKEPTGPSAKDQFFASWLQQHNPGSVLTKVGPYADIINGVQRNQQQPDLLSQVAQMRMGGPGRSGGSAPHHSGHVEFAPGADRPGAQTQDIVKKFLKDTSAAGKGRTLTVGTGTNHSEMTTSGNVSDHWTGHGADIPVPVDSTTGDNIAAHALQQLGIPWKRAQAMAQQGGLYTVSPTSGKYKGHRVQVIWKTTEGGNHHNHVHIGIQ